MIEKFLTQCGIQVLYFDKSCRLYYRNITHTSTSNWNRC